MKLILLLLIVCSQLVHAGIKYSFVNILTVGVTIQNLFNVVVKKIAEKKVEVQISEENLNLSCAIEKRFNKIAKSLKGFTQKKWEEVRDKLGFLMIDGPALIHSYIKTIKSKKKVYFKSLNEKFQSMEGAAPIEI